MNEAEHQGGNLTSGKRVLVVEDHGDTAQLLLAVLAEEGYLVEWVSTIAEALHSLSSCASPLPEDLEKCPHVVLLDLSLPGPDTLETVRQLLRPLASPPRIVLVSARPLNELQAVARAVGAAGIVRKPFSLDALLNTIEESGRTS